MAEAATIIALGTFGAQTAKVVFELVQIRSAIKNSPADVLALLDDTEHLQSLLVARRRQHDDFAGVSIPRPIIFASEDRCEGAAQKLNSIATELLRKIRKQRIGGSLAAYLAKDTILKLQTSVQSARLDLILADQAFMKTLQYNLLVRSGSLQQDLEVTLLRAVREAVNSSALNRTNSLVNNDFFVFIGVDCGNELKILQVEMSRMTDRDFFKVIKERHNRARGFRTYFSVFVLKYFDFYEFQKLGQAEFCRVRKDIPPANLVDYRTNVQRLAAQHEMAHFLDRGFEPFYNGRVLIDALPQRNCYLQAETAEPETFWGLSAIYFLSVYRLLLYTSLSFAAFTLSYIMVARLTWTSFAGYLVLNTVAPYMFLWIFCQFNYEK